MAKLKIGLIHSLSGALRHRETRLLDAALVAVDEINAQGGVLGRPLQPIILDGASIPDIFAERTSQALAEHQLGAIFGGWLSSARRAMLQASAQSAQTIMLWFPGQHEGLESAARTIYTGSCANQLIGPILRWCRHAGHQRLFVMGSDSSFAQVSLELLRAMAPQYELQIVGESRLPAGARDFDPGLDAARQARAQIIINLHHGKSNAAFFQGLAAAGLDASTLPSISTSIFQPEFAQLGALSHGHLLCSTYFPTSPPRPLEQRLLAGLRARQREAANLCEPMICAYQQLHMWHELVSMQCSLDPDTLFQAAANHRFGPVCGDVHLSAHHHAHRQMAIGRADSQGRVQAIWHATQDEEPLPWLGLEKLPSADTALARTVIARLPDLLDISRSAEQRAQEQAEELGRSIRALQREMQKREALETRLQYDAYYDRLTGLPNQRQFISRLQALIDADDGPASIALCLVNLDGFRAINARHGEAVGDFALLKLAQRLAEFLPGGSLLARWTGDEFVFVLRDDDFDARLQDTLDVLKTPIPVNQTRLSVSASIGANLCRLRPGRAAENLVRQASHAMYRAKRHGGSHVVWFDHALEQALQLNTQKQLDIQQAIRDNRLRLFFQPKVDMARGKVLGAEALVRCIGNHEDELIGPGEFLPYLAGSAVEQELDWWVLDTAMAQAPNWQNSHPHFILSVNVNPQTLMQEGFVPRLQQLADKHGVQPRSFELELLESSEIADLANINQLIQSARELGFRFALDDCGAGYSSLAFIRWLNVDTLKIDQSFIRNLQDHRDDAQLVKGLIGLAQAFEREIVAEGVASIELGRILIDLGCHYAQGFAIARPMPADKLDQWLSEYRFPQIWRQT